MTRIEIINEIKPILEELNYPDAVSYLTQNDVNWLKENIKALEQEPCTDAISREMALDCDMNIRLNKSVITQYPVGEYDYLSLRRACFHGIELAKHEMECYLIDLPSVTPQTLEQEPCEDCINRQMVLDLLNEKVEKWMKDKTEPYILFSDIMALPPVTPQQKIGRCKDCKYFEYDSVANVDGVLLIVAHEICKRWGDGCKTKEDGYCFLFEPRESENKNK